MRLQAILIFISLSLQTQAQINFTESAAALGIQHNSAPGGFGSMPTTSSISVWDFNGDGWDDILLGRAGNDSISFYRNDSSAGFTKIPSPFYVPANTRQMMWVDYDNDGDLDFFIAHDYAPNRLFRNNGNFSFTDVTAISGLPIINDPTWSVSWADYDRDGWLDLFVSNYLYASPFALTMREYLFRNKGDGTFEDITIFAGIPDYDHASFACAFTDINNDFWPDLYITSDRQPSNKLLKNDGKNRYIDISNSANANQNIDGMGIAVGDIDNDGWLDLYATGTNPVGNIMLRNVQDETFNNVTALTGTGYFSTAWGCNFADFDNDRNPDLYVSGSITGTSGTSAAMYRNTGGGFFTKLISAAIGMAKDTVHSCAQALGDFNNDGYPDIVVNNIGPWQSHLWMNNGGSNNWIRFQLQGTVSNRDAVGARIEVYSMGTRHIRYTHCGMSFLAQNSVDGLFGLGSIAQLDSVRVLWPSGHIDRLFNVAVNRKYLMIEGSTGAISPLIFSKGDPITCDGGNPVKLYVGGRFGQYLWSNGATTKSIQVTIPGNYSVTVVDPNSNVTSSLPFTVQSLPLPQANISGSSLLCAGDSNAVLAVQASGGTGNMNYQWWNGETTQIVSGLPAGNYWAIARDANGCRDTAFIQLNSPDSLRLNPFIQSPACFGDNDGSISLHPTGGSAPYSILWYNTSTDSIQTNLNTGNYAVLVEDANGCWAYRIFQLQEPPILMASFTTIGVDSLLAQVTGGTAPYRYLWNNGDTTALSSNLLANAWALTITDANGCTAAYSTTSIKHIARLSFKLYPNPARDIFYLSLGDNFPKITELRLTDLFGRSNLLTMIDTSNPSAIEIRLPDRTAGLYILEIIGKNGVIASQKLILY